MPTIEELEKRVEVLEKGLAEISRLECEISKSGDVLMTQIRGLRADLFKVLLSKGGNS